MSGGLKRAKQALGCPLDWRVRRSRVGGQGSARGRVLLEATPVCKPGGDRAVCQSVPELPDQKAVLPQRAHVPLDRPKTQEGAPLVDPG